MKRLMGSGGEGSKRLGKRPKLAEPELWPVRMGKSRRRQQYPRRGRMEAMGRCFFGSRDGVGRWKRAAKRWCRAEISRAWFDFQRVAMSTDVEGLETGGCSKNDRQSEQLCVFGRAVDEWTQSLRKSDGR